MMSTPGSEGMGSGSSDAVGGKTTPHRKQNSGLGKRTTRFAGNFQFGLPRRSGKFSTVGFLKNLGDKMAAALRYVSCRGRRPSPKVSSKPFAAPSDSHRTEAIADCIDFINSSSVKRSSSVSASSS